MKLLKSPVPLAIQEYHKAMIVHVHGQKFAAALKPYRLENVDYEVIYDISHGLPLSVVYADGTRADLGMDSQSLERLIDKLSYSNVMVTMYALPALQKIRFIMRSACIALENVGCDAYDHYIGLMDNSARPFNRREEQALKWATVFHTPINSTATYFRNESLSPDELKTKIDDFRNARLTSSYRLLAAAFSESRARKIYDRFVEAYLNDSFDRLENMSSSNVVVLRR